MHMGHRTPYGLRYILGVKEGDHTVLFQRVQADRTRWSTSPIMSGMTALRSGASGSLCQNDVPLNASNPDVRVNFIQYWEMEQDRSSTSDWVTDKCVSKRNVYHLMRGDEPRWKIENETTNYAEKPRL